MGGASRRASCKGPIHNLHLAEDLIETLKALRFAAYAICMLDYAHVTLCTLVLPRRPYFACTTQMGPRPHQYIQGDDRMHYAWKPLFTRLQGIVIGYGATCWLASFCFTEEQAINCRACQDINHPRQKAYALASNPMVAKLVDQIGPIQILLSPQYF